MNSIYLQKISQPKSVIMSREQLTNKSTPAETVKFEIFSKRFIFALNA